MSPIRCLAGQCHSAPLLIRMGNCGCPILDPLTESEGWTLIRARLKNFAFRFKELLVFTRQYPPRTVLFGSQSRAPIESANGIPPRKKLLNTRIPTNPEKKAFRRAERNILFALILED